MKKTILTTTLLMIAAGGLWAQGVVNFSTIASNPWDFAADRHIYLADGVTPISNTAGYRAQIWQNVGGTFVPVGADAGFLGSSLAGYILGQNRTLNGGGVGVPVTLQVRVWQGAAGSAFDPATGAMSDPFEYIQRSSPIPSTADTLMHNFTAFAVPEPSTIALGVLGLGALLLFRRRK